MHDHWPDAYLAIEQAVEEALQRIAAGSSRGPYSRRAADRRPGRREDELARALTDSPQIPLALEAARYPRPPMPAPPGDSAPVWAAIAAAAHGAAPGPASVIAARAWNGKLMATTTFSPHIVTVIDGGPYDGWHVIGTAERRVCPARRYSDNSRIAYRYTALEAREDGDGNGSTVGRPRPETSNSG